MPELLFSIEDMQASRVRPLCARPAPGAFAGPRPYHTGLTGGAVRSGRANVQADNYWSSTTYAGNTGNAWNVNMNDGNVNNDNKSNNNYVWPVRSGEWSPPSSGSARKGGIFTFENLYQQYLKCRRNKRSTINALKFEVNAEENLFALCEELRTRTYKPVRSVCFVVPKPKMREIIAADFRDRVVHHVLVDRLEAIYEPVFIHDSYACRKGKGLHKAVERVRAFIGKGGENGRKRLFFMHLDIKNFFMTLDKHVLYDILRKRVTEDDLLWLAHTVIFHNPAEHCVIKGTPRLLSSLPPHKSLFHAAKGVGIPVGNLTSQFFANLYLNELDQYAKHVLKCSWYVRYCDDFLILDESPARLEVIKTKIAGFAAERLRLTLNLKHGKVLPVSNGIDFLGYIIRPGYLLVRRRVVNNLKSRLDQFEKELVSEKDGVRTIRYEPDLLRQLRAVLASYRGHLKRANTHRLWAALLERYVFLKEYFAFTEGKAEFLHDYRKVFPSVRSQYGAYARVFGNAVVFFQVGSYFEFYGELKENVREILGLKKLSRSRRQAAYGFPSGLEQRHTERLLNKGLPVVIIRETGRYIGRIQERLPVMKIMKKED